MRVPQRFIQYGSMTSRSPLLSFGTRPDAMLMAILHPLARKPRRERTIMTAKYALLSLVYMMTFVVLFDRFHYKRKLTNWLCGSNLMEQDELERIQAILAACQES
jgi:hypothetical protein